MQSQKETIGMYKLKIINAKSKRDSRYVQSKNHKMQSQKETESMYKVSDHTCKVKNRKKSIYKVKIINAKSK